MKKLFLEDELKVLVDEIITEYVDSLNEDEPITMPRRIHAANQPVAKPMPQKTSVPPVQKATTIAKKPRPTSQTIPGPKDKLKPEPEIKKAYDPTQVKQKQQMSKTQYQIFNIKMRLGKLGLNDTVRRFAQSVHDFDINVTKNSKDMNDIKSYLSPAQGNLEALKGALESMESEFNELEKLLDEE
jgi:hypothetical protein